ncbi:MAG: hypothetical protein V1770_01510 [bacterium]
MSIAVSDRGIKPCLAVVARGRNTYLNKILFCKYNKDMTKRKERIILILGIIAVSVGIFYFVNYYFLTKLPVLVRFNDGVTKEEAVQIIAKYDKTILTRDPQEYDNPFFSFLKPFERGRIFQFEKTRISTLFLKKSIEREKSVKIVKIFSVSYEFAHDYNDYFEELPQKFLNPE